LVLFLIVNLSDDCNLGRANLFALQNCRTFTFGIKQMPIVREPALLDRDYKEATRL